MDILLQPNTALIGMAIVIVVAVLLMKFARPGGPK